MPRPKNERIVNEPPLITDFKPAGIPGRNLEQILLSIDEYEAIRLADLLGKSHEEASDEMGVSRSTFSRLIEKSRKKIAEFIFEGKWLTVEGGNIHFRQNIIKCADCGKVFRTEMEDHFHECPECQSSNLINVAGNFGHGKCCWNKLK